MSHESVMGMSCLTYEEENSTGSQRQLQCDEEDDDFVDASVDLWMHRLMLKKKSGKKSGVKFGLR